MATISRLKNKDGDILYPVTVIDAITDNNGIGLDELIPVIPNLADVATSGSYNDLDDKPIIPNKTIVIDILNEVVVDYDNDTVTVTQDFLDRLDYYESEQIPLELSIGGELRGPTPLAKFGDDAYSLLLTYVTSYGVGLYGFVIYRNLRLDLIEEVVALKGYVDDAIGDINTILNNINGEEI